MKVAYFIGALNRGGAESILLDICKQHYSVPYDFICVYRHEGNMFDVYKQTGAPLVNIVKRFGVIRYLWSIRKLLVREHITIVHSQTPSNTLLLSIALCGTGIKIVTTFHGYNFSKTPWWKRKIVYTHSDKIICVSEHQKLVYEQRWKLPKENKLQVVYNGVDFTKLDGAIDGRVRELECERVKLAMVGNFVDVRSQIVIVKAIDCLRNRGITDFDFYFIGRRDNFEPELYDNCVKYSDEHHLDNIHFLGSRGDVPQILKAIDGFVYSTAHDTFGIAVIEAIAAELPIVVNDWPVMTEVCGDGNAGIRYFHTGDAEDAADKMTALLKDMESSKKTAKENASIVRSRFSIEQHISNLYEIYSSL